MDTRFLCVLVPLLNIAFTVHDVMALWKYLMADNIIATSFSDPETDESSAKVYALIPIEKYNIFFEGNVGRDFCSSAFG